MFGQAVALPAQFLVLLRSQRLGQQFIGVAPRIETGAKVGLQQARTHSVTPQHCLESSHGFSVERHVAQDQHVRAGTARLPDQSLRGVLGDAAIERWRAKRAIGLRTCQPRKGKLIGSPQRYGRQEPDHSRRPVVDGRGIAPGSERGCADAATRGGVYRQCPLGQVIAVRLDGALRERTPRAGRDVGERQQRRRARGILDRCTSDHPDIGNFGHVPAFPLTTRARRRTRRRLLPSRSQATLAEENGKYCWCRIAI